MTPLTWHPNEDELELYSMHRTSPEQTEKVEEHLLICIPCQDKLDAVDEEIQLIRSCLKDLEDIESQGS